MDRSLASPGILDGTPDLVGWADRMEAAAMKTIADGVMTGDLSAASDAENKRIATTGRICQRLSLDMNTKLEGGVYFGYAGRKQQH